jgi:hypothetical protein
MTGHTRISGPSPVLLHAKPLFYLSAHNLDNIGKGYTNIYTYIYKIHYDSQLGWLNENSGLDPAFVTKGPWFNSWHKQEIQPFCSASKQQRYGVQEDSYSLHTRGKVAGA